MKYLLPLASTLLLILGCAKDSVDPVIDQNPTNHGQINLQNMQVGQQNNYLLFIGQEYHNPDSHQDYAYEEDTLRVKIVEKATDQFLWQEIHANSITGLPDTMTYWVSIEDDSLRIDASDNMYSYSHLFHQLSLHTWSVDDYTMKIPLNDFTSQECDVLGWKTNLVYSESYHEAYDPSFSLFQVDHGRVNVIVDNIPMQVDGNGKTYVYNRESGIVRTVTYSWWTGQGMGWDLLPDK